MGEDVVVKRWNDLKDEIFLYRAKGNERTPYHFGIRVSKDSVTGDFIVTYCLDTEEDQLFFHDKNMKNAIDEAIKIVEKRNRGEKA